MATEAEMRRKITVSIVAVGVFIALTVGIGAIYNQSRLVSIGGLAFVGAITTFILVTAGIGVWLPHSS